MNSERPDIKALHQAMRRCSFILLASRVTQPSMLFLLTFTLLLSGCSKPPAGPQRAAVSGTVQLNGTPLTQGIIRFVPTDGTQGPKVSLPITNGQFAADPDHGPVAGTNRIEIQSTDNGGLAIDDEQAVEQLRQKPQKISVVTVPPIYNTHSQLKEQLLTDQVNELKYQLQTPTRR